MASARLTPAAAKPLTDDVYARVRALILASRLRPGEKLVDRDLAERLGVSRTPVREALARLAMTGLVEARSRRGYYVAQYDSEQMSELYEFRKILEVAAAGMAAQNAQPEHLRKMKRMLVELEQLTLSPDGPGNPVKTVELDLQIHDVIAQAAGNHSLQVAIENLMDKILAFIWVDWVNVSITAHPDPVAQREHKALLRSILEKDAKAATRIMSTHIDNARRGLEEVLQNRAVMQSSVLSAR